MVSGESLELPAISDVELNLDVCQMGRWQHQSGKT